MMVFLNKKYFSALKTQLAGSLFGVFPLLWVILQGQTTKEVYTEVKVFY